MLTNGLTIVIIVNFAISLTNKVSFKFKKIVSILQQIVKNDNNIIIALTNIVKLNKDLHLPEL